MLSRAEATWPVTVSVFCAGGVLTYSRLRQARCSHFAILNASPEGSGSFAEVTQLGGGKAGTGCQDWRWQSQHTAHSRYSGRASGVLKSEAVKKDGVCAL